MYELSVDTMYEMSHLFLTLDVPSAKYAAHCTFAIFVLAQRRIPEFNQLFTYKLFLFSLLI